MAAAFIAAMALAASLLIPVPQAEAAPTGNPATDGTYVAGDLTEINGDGKQHRGDYVGKAPALVVFSPQQYANAIDRAGSETGTLLSNYFDYDEFEFRKTTNKNGFDEPSPSNLKIWPAGTGTADTIAPGAHSLDFMVVKPGQSGERSNYQFGATTAYVQKHYYEFSEPAENVVWATGTMPQIPAELMELFGIELSDWGAEAADDLDANLTLNDAQGANAGILAGTTGVYRDVTFTATDTQTQIPDSLKGLATNLSVESEPITVIIGSTEERSESITTDTRTTADIPAPDDPDSVRVITGPTLGTLEDNNTKYVPRDAGEDTFTIAYFNSAKNNVTYVTYTVTISNVNTDMTVTGTVEQDGSIELKAPDAVAGLQRVSSTEPTKGTFANGTYTAYADAAPGEDTFTEVYADEAHTRASGDTITVTYSVTVTEKSTPTPPTPTPDYTAERNAAKNKIDQAAQEAIDGIDKLEYLTDEERQQAIDEIHHAAEEGKGNVDNAGAPSAIDQATKDAIDDIQKALDDAKAKNEANAPIVPDEPGEPDNPNEPGNGDTPDQPDEPNRPGDSKPSENGNPNGGNGSQGDPTVAADALPSTGVTITLAAVLFALLTAGGILALILRRRRA